MDRDEAIRLLKGGPDGVREWDRRRRQDEEIPVLRGVDLRDAFLGQADLRDAVLRRADLRRAALGLADLRGADLRGADFSGAFLGHADLRRAVLRRADLHGAALGSAVLRRADLRGADLSHADLRGADLSHADLRGADLSGAQLRRAHLGQAVCSDTSFGDVDLSAVKGLESIRHRGPSSVGVDTLVRSRGKIPEAFLRGCGVPNSVIANLNASIGAIEPIQFSSCFLSHSSKDQPFADRLHGRMEQEKLRVWDAPEDLRGGRKSVDQIDRAIRAHDKLLLVLSKASMASDWVRHEIAWAVERERREGRRVLFPIGLSPWKEIQAWAAFDPDLGQDVAKVVREYHVPDFSKWQDQDAFEAAFARLLEDLKAPTSADEKTKKPGRKGLPKRP
jgi:hypothetical protein